jgi:hypothetical protein
MIIEVEAIEQKRNKGKNFTGSWNMKACQRISIALL